MLNSLIWDGTGRVKQLGLEHIGNGDKQKPRNVRWRSCCTALEELDVLLTLAALIWLGSPRGRLCSQGNLQSKETARQSYGQVFCLLVYYDLTISKTCNCDIM